MCVCVCVCIISAVKHFSVKQKLKSEVSRCSLRYLMTCDCPAFTTMSGTNKSLCVSYLLPLDEVMYLRIAFGTSIVSSFTNTMSKELMYDSFLSST